MGAQISSKKSSIHAYTSVFVSLPQPLNHTEDWIPSFYIALFKSRNYGCLRPTQTLDLSLSLKLNLNQRNNTKQDNMTVNLRNTLQ